MLDLKRSMSITSDYKNVIYNYLYFNYRQSFLHSKDIASQVKHLYSSNQMSLSVYTDLIDYITCVSLILETYYFYSGVFLDEQA